MKPEPPDPPSMLDTPRRRSRPTWLPVVAVAGGLLMMFAALAGAETGPDPGAADCATANVTAAVATTDTPGRYDIEFRFGAQSSDIDEITVTPQGGAPPVPAWTAGDGAVTHTVAAAVGRSRAWRWTVTSRCTEPTGTTTITGTEWLTSTNWLHAIMADLRAVGAAADSTDTAVAAQQMEQNDLQAALAADLRLLFDHRRIHHEHTFATAFEGSLREHVEEGNVDNFADRGIFRVAHRPTTAVTLRIAVTEPADSGVLTFVPDTVSFPAGATLDQRWHRFDVIAADDDDSHDEEIGVTLYWTGEGFADEPIETATVVVIDDD